MANDETTGDPDSGSPDRATQSPRTSAPRKNPKARSASKPRASLIDSDGPEPTSDLQSVKLSIGRIGGTHGVDGELKMRVLTDHPEHLVTITRVFLGESDAATALLGVRFQGDLALIRLEGVTTPEQGKQLGGLTVRIAGEDALPLAEDEYFLFQLIGLRVLDEADQVLGWVTDLLETGAHDVLVIGQRDDRRGSELLVPNHPEYVLRIAPEDGMIVIRPPRYSS